MWRTFASIALTFGAVAWSAFAVILIFVVVPGVWETLFGRTGAVFGALGALAARGVVFGEADALGRQHPARP